MEAVELGNTGLHVSRLSVGTGTNGWGHRSEQTSLGVEGLAALLRASYERGINFWDTADSYGAHRHVARALRDVPRDQIVIATKTTARSGVKVSRHVERFLRELNTDVINIVLLHCLMSKCWPDRLGSAMRALSRAKEEGKVQAVGVSCHSLGALHAAAQTPWVDVVLARINYAGVNMDGTPEQVVPVLESLYRAGKAIYGMKVLGCGSLAHDPRAAFRYVLSLGTVHAITVGTSSLAHLEQNVRLMEELAPAHPLAPRHHTPER